MTEEQFFTELLGKTKASFLKSETYRLHGDKNWNYAICDTPIQKGKGVFFGLNWGGNDIDVQSQFPPKIKDRNWPFISNSRTYIQEFFKAEVEDLNYSNLCFFRSPGIQDLEKADWSLALPLFQEYIDFIQPCWTLMLGKPSPIWRDYLTEKQIVSVYDDVNRKKAFGYSGLLFGKFPFGAVPHPQARISTPARREIWRNVREKIGY